MIIVLTVIAFFAAVLLLSVCFNIHYDGEFAVKLSFGPFRFKLYPAKSRKKNKAKPKKSKSKAPKASKTPEKKQKKDFFETVSIVIDVIKSVLGPAARLLKRVRITSLDATVTVATGDAAETAELYGKTSAAVYGAVVGLKNFITVKVKNLFVGYDFNLSENTYKVDFKIKIRLVYVIAAAAAMLIRLVKNIAVKGSGAERLPAENAGERAA